MADPLCKHDPRDEDDAARRRGEELVAHLHALGMTDEEILSDDSVEMTVEEMAAWLKSGAPSPIAPRR